MRSLFLLAAFLLMSFDASAGVKEKKAKQAAGKAAQEGIAQMKKDCGNAAVKHTINFKDADPEKIDMLAGRVEELFRGIVYVCGSDADYKEEIAKLKIVAISFDKADPNKFAFKLKGKTLQAILCQSYSRSSGDVGASLKKVFE